MSATEIACRLKKARLDAGLTQKDVSTRLGITYQAISNYERGINRVDTDTLIKLCSLYEINISDLLRTPAWNQEMFDAYHASKTDQERKHLLEIWGCPAELIESENNLRKPAPSLLSPEDEELLFKFHALDARGQAAVLNVLRHEYDSLPGEKTSCSTKEA